MTYFNDSWKEIESQERAEYRLRLRDFIPIAGLREYHLRTRDMRNYDAQARRTISRNLGILCMVNSPFLIPGLFRDEDFRLKGRKDA